MSDHLWQLVLKNIKKINIPRDNHDGQQNENEDIDIHRMVDQIYSQIENEGNILKAYTFGVPIKNHGQDG